MNPFTQLFIIHSYNGGGIRGLILCVFMEMASRLYPSLKVLPNLIAGTSTGAIVATLRALGISWPRIIQFYTVYGFDIFKKSFFPRWFRSKYSDKTLNRLLKQYIGENTMIQDIDNVLLVICTTRVSDDTLTVWTSKGSYIDKGDGFEWSEENGKNAKLWEVVRASAAAPRYFNAYKINGEYHSDGGMKANNPSQIGYNIARTQCEEICKIALLSVTTGRKTHNLKESDIDESDVNDGIQVASDVIDSTLDAIDKNVHYSLQHQVRNTDIYVRCESVVKYSDGSVDNASSKNIDNMKKDGEVSFDKNLKKVSAFINYIS